MLALHEQDRPLGGLGEPAAAAAAARLVAETRRQRDSDAAAVLTLSTATNLKLQQADNELMQLRAQLAELNQHNEQLRAAFNSAPMISMLRELEETRRDTSMLRGAMEQMQRELQHLLNRRRLLASKLIPPC